MSKTIITNPDGSKTTVEKQGGCCSSGCMIFLVLALIGIPAAYFPGPIAVLAYILLGIAAIGAIAGYGEKQGWWRFSSR